MYLLIPPIHPLEIPIPPPRRRYGYFLEQWKVLSSQGAGVDDFLNNTILCPLQTLLTS